MERFIYATQPARVIFGLGSRRELSDEIDRAGWSRALVLSTSGQRRLAEEVADLLGAAAVGVSPTAVMHVPAEVANAGAYAARSLDADVTIAVGGGSTIGLAKGIAALTGIPIVALPTTFAGSEMTNQFGITEAGLKRTTKDDRVLPKLVIYDAELSAGLPSSVAAVSGMNAIAHSVEAHYGPGANPIVSVLADESVRSLGDALPRLVRDPDDLPARQQAFVGAMLAGQVLSLAGVGLHHKLCHTLGGSFGMPHAEVHTVVLPHAAAYNAPAAPAAFARVAQALGAVDAPRGLYDLAGGLGTPRSLKEIGFKVEDLRRAAEIACSSPYPNPRPVEVGPVLDLLTDAYEGRPPRTWTLDLRAA